MIIHPRKLAQDWLQAAGIKISELYSPSTGEINKIELRKIYAFNPVLAQNIIETFNRLNASDNPNIKFNENLKTTLIGSMTTEIMKNVSDGETKSKPTLIKWMPSTAKEPDAYHSRFYGRVMTLKAAQDLGLGIRWGCKCGFQVLSGGDVFKSRLRKTKATL